MDLNSNQSFLVEKIMKITKIALGALGLALAVPAFAAPIADDGLGNTGSGFVTAGTGVGNFFLTVKDTARNQTFVLNLGGNVLNTVQSPANWAVTSSALQTFIAGGSAANMSWNVAGVSNYDADQAYPLPTIGIVTTNQGQTDFGADGFGPFFTAMSNAGSYIAAVNATGALNSSNSAVFNGNGGATGSNANEYNGTFAWFTFDNRVTGFGASQYFSFVSYQSDPTIDPVASETIDRLGSIGIDAATGTVSFTAATSSVPVPAAIWLMGSALVGLGGIGRRRAIKAA
jgi:hypothetical protein